MEQPMTQSARGSDEEGLRIRTAYQRRKASAKPGRYSYLAQGELFAIQQQERRILKLLKRWAGTPLKVSQVLDVGCGRGYWLRELIKWGARPENLYGVDLLSERVAEAKRLCPETVTLQCGNATKLDFPDAVFDLVLQVTVFTSILDAAMKEQIAAEMLRVLRPDGLIIWHDFWVDNPWNPDVRGVKQKEIRRLFPACRIKLQRATLAPPIPRRLAPYSWLLCLLLEKIPWLRTHYLGVIRKA